MASFGVDYSEVGMPYEVQGVVSRAKGAPVSPGSVRACGVRRTGPHYREGGITGEFPFLLGQEAAGFVEAVGDGVTVW